MLNIDNIKNFIHTYNGSMRELSQHSGVNYTMLYKIMKGERSPGFKTLQGLVKAGLKKEDILK